MSLEEGPVLEAHSVLTTQERQQHGWRLVITYVAFGREDAALGIVNDVLDEMDRRRPGDRALALDCLSALLLRLASDATMRYELTPYIAEFAYLAQRATRTQPDQALGLLSAYLLDSQRGLEIDELTRSRLNDVQNACAALPGPGSATPAPNENTPTQRGELESLAQAAARLEASLFSGTENVPAQLVFEHEIELRDLEGRFDGMRRAPDGRAELHQLFTRLNAAQLEKLLAVGALAPAMRRAFRLFRNPRSVMLLHDQVRGASLFLMLARMQLDAEAGSSSAFYNARPVRAIRKTFSELIVPGALDNQLLPLLARNLDVVRPLTAELLTLYAARPHTHESGFALILTLNELVFDRMAWKIQELNRTGRRVEEETGVLLSEYEKLVFGRPQAPESSKRSAPQSRQVPYKRILFRMSDHAERTHLFAPRHVIAQLRQDMDETECLLTFHLDRNGLWLGMLRQEMRPIVQRLCDSATAAAVISAHREDERSGAIRMWQEADYRWFGECILDQVRSHLPTGVRWLVVLGSQVDIPIHAAFLPGYGYGIEHFSVTYEQSRRSLSTGRKWAAKAPQALTVVAYRGRGGTSLPAVEAEASQILARFQGRLATSRVLSTCRSVKSAVRTHGIDAIHLAGHMRDPADETGWHLQLRDGDLDCLGTLRRIAGNLRLAVLMACSAGANVGRSRSLEAGLPHALIALGTGAVVAPRRPIDDHLAASFSASFYSRLAISDDLPEAFRQGVVDLIDGHRPGAWSSLVLNGR